MKLLISCGLGEFVSLACHTSESQRAAVTELGYFTRHEPMIRQISHLFFPNARETSLYRKWLSDEEISVRYGLRENHKPHLETPGYVELKPGPYIFPEILNQLLALVVPPTMDYYLIYNHGDLTEQDQNNTIEFLYKNKTRGVVVGKSWDKPSPWIINHCNQYYFLQIVELLKRARGYTGSESVFSVLACKFFFAEDIRIKGTDTQEARYHCAPLQYTLLEHL